MCRTHRIFIAVTTAMWAVTIFLALTTEPTGAGHKFFILTGCMAVVLVPYCAFPWLVADMLDEKMKDTMGAFIAGWQAAQEAYEPDEPATVHPIRSCS